MWRDRHEHLRGYVTGRCIFAGARQLPLRGSPTVSCGSGHEKPAATAAAGRTTFQFARREGRMELLSLVGGIPRGPQDAAEGSQLLAADSAGNSGSPTKLPLLSAN